MTGENQFDPLLTAAQAAKLLGYSEGTIRNYASDGTIPSTKLPTGALRFRLSELEAWIRSHTPTQPDNDEAPAA